MYEAIKHNKYQFVQAFLEHGLILSKFLTHRRLLKLYNDIDVTFQAYILLFT